MYSTVLTASRSRALSEGLTYENGDLKLEPGMLVRVPLRGQIAEGIVLATNVAKPESSFRVRPVVSIESTEPVLNKTQLKTLQWMATYYCCSPRQAATVFLPPLPWRGLLPKPERWLKLSKKKDVRSSKQQSIIDLLANGDWRKEDDVKEATGVSDSIIRAMIKDEILIREDRRPQTANARTHAMTTELPTLTDIQEKALKEIRSTYKPTLLFGITGSGKTEIYQHLIVERMKEGKQSILLVPEILLSEELLHRFVKLLGEDRIAILHSRLSLAQRRDVWRRIANGDIVLVLGSRSALFAPCRNLGLVILDEEHEWTYKNEQTPRYHARDTAEILCRESGAKLLLGSATPSTESWKRAMDKTYGLSRLPERYQNHPLPDVRVVDLATASFGKHYPFSPPLIEAIRKRLEAKEQCVLFLNRRGMATSVLCLECRKRLVSKESQLPLTLHEMKDGTPILLDHTTGTFYPLPAKCPYCQSIKLLPVGAGTQRLENLLATLFPKARVLRADSDTLKRPEDIRALLGAMRDRSADILLGTQSVVKGLDLPQVTLAAVLLADVGMSLPHFRAGERVFQLLTQLTGRSGRSKPGEVIIQTFRPDSPEVRHAAAHATEKFLEEELQLRHEHSYPPSAHMARLIIQETDGKKAKALVKQINETDKTFHASAAPTYFGAGKTWHVLIRGPKPAHELLSKLTLEGVTVDVDPVDCL